MPNRVIHLAVCVCLLACARDASAQIQMGTPWTEYGYFNFNIGFESGSGELNDAATVPI